MKQQTAVEWLEDKIQSDMTFMEVLGLIRQAKEMEKKQIEDAYNEGRAEGVGYYIDTEWGRDVTELTAEEYYKETFKSE